MWNMNFFFFTSSYWDHRNCHWRAGKYVEIILGMHLVDFVKNRYAGNITQNNVSARLWNLKPEWWSVPSVQEDNYEGKEPDVGRCDDDDDDDDGEEEKEVEDQYNDNNHFMMFGAFSNTDIATSDSVNTMCGSNGRQSQIFN